MSGMTLKTDIFIKWDFVKLANIEPTLDMAYTLWMDPKISTSVKLPPVATTFPISYPW